jgi:hypothetical protein
MEIYLILAFIVSYLFLAIYMDDNYIYLYASFLALILYTFQKSIPLCGLMVVVLVYYVIKQRSMLN